MIEEPYRWLEAIGNRREYIREQLKGATPVFAVSRPEGILLLGTGQGQSKVFEIFDRHGFAGLGHPVDIEKLRQSAIEAAHVEGFNRSAKDVTMRRLVNFALSPSIKNAFEQIFSPPLIVESIFAEVADEPERDVLVRIHYDGNHQYQFAGQMVAFVDADRERQASEWLGKQLKASDGLGRVVDLCLAAWRGLVENQDFGSLPAPTESNRSIPGKKLEAALLDRKASGLVHYRELDASQL